MDSFEDYELGLTDAQTVLNRLHGWNGYATQGDTYGLRKKIRQYIEHQLQKKNE